MKHCGGCDTWKDESEFNWKNRALRIRHAQCKVCQARYTKEHYRKNPAPYLLRAKERNRRVQGELQRFVFQYLVTHPCVDCGETDPIVLEFDHVDGKKETEISVLVQNSVSLAKVQEEIAKC